MSSSSKESGTPTRKRGNEEVSTPTKTSTPKKGSSADKQKTKKARIYFDKVKEVTSLSLDEKTILHGAGTRAVELIRDAKHDITNVFNPLFKTQDRTQNAPQELITKSRLMLLLVPFINSLDKKVDQYETLSRKSSELQKSKKQKSSSRRKSKDEATDDDDSSSDDSLIDGDRDKNILEDHISLLQQIVDSSDKEDGASFAEALDKALKLEAKFKTIVTKIDKDKFLREITPLKTDLRDSLSFMSAISEATGIEKHVPTSLAKADDIQEKAVDKAHNLVDAINTTNKCIEQLLNAIKNENQAAQEASKAFGDAFGAYETTNNMLGNIFTDKTKGCFDFDRLIGHSEAAEARTKKIRDAFEQRISLIKQISSLKIMTNAYHWYVFNLLIAEGDKTDFGTHVQKLLQRSNSDPYSSSYTSMYYYCLEGYKSYKNVQPGKIDGETYKNTENQLNIFFSQLGDPATIDDDTDDDTIRSSEDEDDGGNNAGRKKRGKHEALSSAVGKITTKNIIGRIDKLWPMCIDLMDGILRLEFDWCNHNTMGFKMYDLQKSPLDARLWYFPTADPMDVNCAVLCKMLLSNTLSSPSCAIIQPDSFSINPSDGYRIYYLRGDIETNDSAPFEFGKHTDDRGVPIYHGIMALISILELYNCARKQGFVFEFTDKDAYTIVDRNPKGESCDFAIHIKKWSKVIHYKPTDSFNMMSQGFKTLFETILYRQFNCFTVLENTKKINSIFQYLDKTTSPSYKRASDRDESQEIDKFLDTIGDFLVSAKEAIFPSKDAIYLLQNFIPLEHIVNECTILAMTDESENPMSSATTAGQTQPIFIRDLTTSELDQIKKLDEEVKTNQSTGLYSQDVDAPSTLTPDEKLENSTKLINGYAVYRNKPKIIVTYRL